VVWQASDAGTPEKGVILCSCTPTFDDVIQQLLAFLCFFIPNLHGSQRCIKEKQGVLHT